MIITCSVTSLDKPSIALSDNKNENAHVFKKVFSSNKPPSKSPITDVILYLLAIIICLIFFIITGKIIYNESSYQEEKQ